MDREFPWTLKYLQRKKQQRFCRILQPSSVTTNGITESTDENGKITVTFSVMCTYVNGTADDSIDTETTPEEDVETYMNGDQYIYPDMEGSTESGEADNE